MSLILDIKGKEPTVVLGTGAVSGITLDPATPHHDLPDAFVQSSSNCCGSGSNGYRYDGKEYQQATEQLEADLASQISDEVKDPGVPGVDTRPGCSLKEGSFWNDSDNPGLKIIVSLCDDEDQTRVWLIRRGVADKQASEILAREDLSHQDVVVTWEKQAKTIDVNFPDAKPASVTWHFDKNKFTRIPPATPPASGEAAGSK